MGVVTWPREISWWLGSCRPAWPVQSLLRCASMEDASMFNNSSINTKIKDTVLWWAFMNWDLRCSSSCICSTSKQCASHPGKHTFEQFFNFKIEELKGSSSCLLQLWVSAVMLCLLCVDCVNFFFSSHRFAGIKLTFLPSAIWFELVILPIM